jgi:hypothetical protein
VNFLIPFLPFSPKENGLGKQRESAFSSFFFSLYFFFGGKRTEKEEEKFELFYPPFFHSFFLRWTRARMEGRKRHNYTLNYYNLKYNIFLFLFSLFSPFLPLFEKKEKYQTEKEYNKIFFTNCSHSRIFIENS